MHVQLFESSHNNCRDDDISKPVMIRRYNVPRSPSGASLFQSIPICLHVLGPELSFRQVVNAKFPPLCRIIKSILQSFLLLVFVNVQIELQYGRTFFAQRSFEIVDFLVAGLPDFFRN